jgi:hypothetical protein
MSRPNSCSRTFPFSHHAYYLSDATGISSYFHWTILSTRDIHSSNEEPKGRNPWPHCRDRQNHRLCSSSGASRVVFFICQYCQTLLMSSRRGSPSVLTRNGALSTTRSVMKPFTTISLHCLKMTRRTHGWLGRLNGGTRALIPSHDRTYFQSVGRYPG